MTQVKKKPDLLAIELEDFWALKRPIKAFGQEANLPQKHPVSPLEQEWPPFHPALELNINQQIHKFASQLHPLLEGFWSRVKDLNLSKDIFDRWHQRRLTVLLETEADFNHQDKIRDYFVALLFERVYARALETREQNIVLRDKAWKQHIRFRDWQVEKRVLDKLASQNQHHQLLVHPYEYEVTIPNENKHRPNLDEKLWQKRLEQTFLEAHQTFQHFFSERFLKMVDSNRHAFSKKLDRKQLLDLFEHTQTMWNLALREILKNNHIIPDQLETHHKNLDGLVGPTKNLSTPVTPTTEQIVRPSEALQRLQIENQSKPLLTESIDPQAEANDPNSMNSEHTALHETALFPQAMRESVGSPESTSPQGKIGSGPKELEISNGEQRDSKQKREDIQISQDIVDRISQHNQINRQLLAGHDYARQSSLGATNPSSSSTAEQAKDTVTSIKKTSKVG